MYSTVAITAKYIKYLISASNGHGHGIHSPFVYNFIRDVLNDKTAYPEYIKIEELRNKLLHNQTPVPIEDFGAGSQFPSVSKSVSQITRDSSKNARYGQLLFRITRYYKPHYVVELGTSLGMSTAYLGAADESSVIVSGEGNYALASLARENLISIGVGNVRIITGNFNNTLPEILGSIPHVDLAFIDGNHRRIPTVAYFHELLHRKSPESIFIFDDIHWSRDMEYAWEEIKSHPAVMLSVDLFFFGIIFFRPEFKAKQHFTIRF